MNGGAEDKNSTLECVLFAKELLEFSKTFGIKLIISGGTNINTPEIISDSFADVEDYPIIAYGTYARKIVSNVQKDVALLRAQELYNITEGNYYIKVYNKNADFVSKEYTLKILGYGEIPAKLEIFYDFDMDGQKLDFNEGLHYAFQNVLLPGARVTDGKGNRVPNVNVTLEWIVDTMISPNNGHQTMIKTTY